MIVPPGELATDKWGNVMMPLSAKGILFENGRLWLRQNEFGRWELPGGRVDRGEQPEQTVVRELTEELGVESKNPQLVDVAIWEKDFGNNPIICMVAFRCEFVARTGELELEGEAGVAQFMQCTVAEALALPTLPDIYKRAIRKADRYENNRHQSSS